MESEVFMVKENVMFLHGAMLRDCIEQEKAGIDFTCSEKDRNTLRKMLEDINTFNHSNYQYLAEVVLLDMSHSRSIIADYITKFDSETVRAYLVPHIVSKSVKNCDKFILDLYLHFKKSDEYLPKIDDNSPAHIYARYDNAFKQLKSKKIENELSQLVDNPLDVFYLPLTVRMLSKWKNPRVEIILIKFLSNPDNILQHSDIQVYLKNMIHYSAKEFQRELLFTAIDGLKYFPSTENIKLLESCYNSLDSNIKLAVEKSLRIMTKNQTNQGTVL